MQSLSEIQNELTSLRARVVDGQRDLLTAWRDALTDSGYAPDAANLAAYIAFRREDLRGLQERLSQLGLSSLGRCEGHVVATLDAVALALDALLGAAAGEAVLLKTGRANRQGDKRLQKNTLRLLGREPKQRRARIMVTLPTAAAGEIRFVRDLVEHGMDIARINCAHDDADTWKAMIANVRAAAGAAGRECLIHMDLAGPKLRTGEMAETPGRLRLKPKRDERGDTRAPAYFLFDASGEPGGPGLRGAIGLAGYPRLSVARDWLDRLRPGDLVEATDTRGKKRIFNVLERTGEAHMLACAADSVWLEQGCALKHLSGEGKQRANRVGALENMPEALLVHVGDRLLLSRDPAPGSAGDVDGDAGRIPCAQPEVLDSLRVGERVFIDDGQIGAEVERLDAAGAWLRITRARPEGDKIRPAKGLNFPDSEIQLPALGEKDLLDLDFVAREADIVGYSFVQSAADMDRLADELEARGAGGMGRIAKIETRRAVANLPEIVVHGASRGPFGLMIARGDLAVEIGWSRLAEIQEEMLWLAEAAHVPVVWATQVFEQLIKVNLPSRAEMTDAAMAERAECVMLNKGPFVLDAIAMLDDIARRMRAHQHKKSARLRALHW
ncbi:MAG: pyruvate kinase [Pseudomonadota bacterium]|nr:pyruvate kinase [Pseudomonadota bacterium]MDP1902635.1 pyruvate kinase [Pseudomonadota bacterium]MDP2351951.1 pyruvate kinase [Pseudomonadota bacterium]